MSMPATRPTVNARLLAALAEWADGFREEELLLVLTADKTYELKRKDELERGDEVILDVFTRARRRSGLKPATIVVQPEGGRPVNVEKKFDALFWTESAIEKFLLPYYHSQRLLDEEQIRRLKDSFMGENVVALGHTPPTYWKALGADQIPIAVLEQVGTMEKGGALTATGLDNYLNRLR